MTLSSRQKNNTGLKLIFALNYGSKDEIISAVKTIASDVKSDKYSIEDITEETLSRNLLLQIHQILIY